MIYNEMLHGNACATTILVHWSTNKHFIINRFKTVSNHLNMQYIYPNSLRNHHLNALITCLCVNLSHPKAIRKALLCSSET